MVLKIDQTQQSFVNSKECVEGKRGEEGKKKKKREPCPLPLLPIGNNNSVPQRLGFALPSLKKAFCRSSGWYRLVSRCVDSRSLFVQSHYNFQRCLVYTCLRKLQESALCLSQRVVSKHGMAWLTGIFDACKRKKFWFVHFPSFIPSTGTTLCFMFT